MFEREREKGRVSELSKLLSTIYEYRLVGIRRAKNESSLLDEGYAYVPKRRDFTEDPKEEVLGNRIFWD